MKRLIIGLIVALGLAGASGAQEPWQISPDGVGPIRIGMTAKQALAAVQRVAPGVDVASPSDDGGPADCETYELGSPYSIAFRIQKGRVIRVSAGSGFVTATGIKYGDPETAVRAAYPKLEWEGDSASPAHAVYWWKTRTSGLRFEIDDRGEVIAIHGGDRSIRFDDGCR